MRDMWNWLYKLRKKRYLTVWGWIGKDKRYNVAIADNPKISTDEYLVALAYIEVNLPFWKQRFKETGWLERYNKLLRGFKGED